MQKVTIKRLGCVVEFREFTTRKISKEYNAVLFSNPVGGKLNAESMELANDLLVRKMILDVKMSDPKAKSIFKESWAALSEEEKTEWLDELSDGEFRKLNEACQKIAESEEAEKKN